MTIPAVYAAYAKGVDLSHYNGDVHGVVAASDYAISQASVGTIIDPAYAADSAVILADHKVGAAYHYGVYGPGPTRQAQKFLSVVGDRPAFLALDAETRGSNRLLDHPDTISALIVNIRRLDPHKRNILLYASEDATVLVNGRQVSIWRVVTEQDDNWVAKWGDVPPSIPWRFWQYSGTGVDKDVFHGTVAQLRAWV